MASPQASDIMGRVTLVTGPEEFLSERTVTAAVAAARTADPEAELTETAADQMTPGTLGDLAAPSLFSSSRCVVVRGLQDLPEQAQTGMVDYAGAPVEDVGLVLVHSGGNKGKGLLDRLRKQPAVTELKSEALKPHEYPRFVTAEVRSQGGRIDEEGADLLVQSVGQDLRALAAACDQLAHDFPGEMLGSEVVRRYFGGRAEAKSFAVADAAILGRTAVALEELRWALDNGTSPVLVTSAFAGGLRGLGRVMTASQGMREADLAREAGVPPWKVRILRNQARGWSPVGVARAITTVARADAEVKGAASDPAYALERMVLGVVRARGGP